MTYPNLIVILIFVDKCNVHDEVATDALVQLEKQWIEIKFM